MKIATGEKRCDLAEIYRSAPRLSDSGNEGLMVLRLQRNLSELPTCRDKL